MLFQCQEDYSQRSPGSFLIDRSKWTNVPHRCGYRISCQNKSQLIRNLQQKFTLRDSFAMRFCRLSLMVVYGGMNDPWMSVSDLQDSKSRTKQRYFNG